ncbi:MAG: hypothetical protein M1818_005479 [Claussenomyces sp. TS43310]|nr:MAG: hypothetical protein M1818_005479 [Claussenomyces sp. TS43310]
MSVRTNNEPHLNATQSYIDSISDQLRPLLVTNDGPILMVQIENEYGGWGDDHNYTNAMRDMLGKAFNLTMYTNDYATQDAIQAGMVPGTLTEIDGNATLGFRVRDQYVANTSCPGPALNGELYTSWFDHFGAGFHNSISGHSSAIQEHTSELDFILTNNGSFSIYMFHGGTHWGFTSGSNWDNGTEPVTTSYDYGAPLDETGRPNDIYTAFREIIASHVGNDSIPPLVSSPPMVTIPNVTLTPTVGLLDLLSTPVAGELPVVMEALGQSFGHTLYRHIVTPETAISGGLQPGDTPRDRVLVYVNGKRQGVIDSVYQPWVGLDLDLAVNDTLDLLVENMGRVCTGDQLTDQRKGLYGNVSVDGTVLTQWNMYALPLDAPLTAVKNVTVPTDSTSSPPLFYSGSFDLATIGDTFLELPGWVKGAVWVNGYSIGRYWIIGPQQSYFIPGIWLQKANNTVVVLALEPNTAPPVVYGVTNRTWAEYPDPDKPAGNFNQR